MALLLGNFLALVTAVGSRSRRAVFTGFMAALWREGANPNPGRPYATLRYAREVS
jgi:hypothetical protein